MTTTVSRFAVLKIQDDEDTKAAQRAANLKNRSEAKSSKKTGTVDKDLIEKRAAKKKKNAKEKAEVFQFYSIKSFTFSQVIHLFQIESL